MEVYRAAKPKRAKDLSGIGSSLAEGRWNYPGRLVVYTASSPALAMFEKLVHVNLARMPSDMCVSTIEIPDKASITVVREKHLPKGWADDPGPDELRKIGDDWLSKGDTLLLCVPSALSRHQVNYLINPTHKEMSQVKVVRVEPAKAYERLAKKIQDGIKP
jgi:RES domain-containing protein